MSSRGQDRDRAASATRYYRAMLVAWPLVKRRFAVGVFALAAVALTPVFAGQSAVDLDLSPGVPPPADTGKPAIVPPSVTALGQIEAGSCLKHLPCGTRLLGTVRRNGAVEVQVPALRW